MRHGTRAMYNKGKCRCAECSAANAAYAAKWSKSHPRNRSNDATRDPERAVKLIKQHGTTTGYNYGCRNDCPGNDAGLTCREAVNIYQRTKNGGTAPKSSTPKYGVPTSTKRR